MSEYRSQSRNADPSGSHVFPIVVNNNNFAKGEPTLLSFDDAVTLFHEFGHGMHGMLSNVTYQRLSGTNVLRDFVELPSQLFEHWLSESEVLKKHVSITVTISIQFLLIIVCNFNRRDTMPPKNLSPMNS